MTRRAAYASALAGLLTLVIAMSFGRWWMEGTPKSFWRARHPAIDYEYCPDGKAIDLRAMAETLKGTEGAADYYVLRHRDVTHQASTQLVDVLGAPWVVWGWDPAYAFVLVSTLASIGATGCVLWWSRRLMPGQPTAQLFTVALFLLHPGTVRCFCRPQTDALLGLAALVAVTWGARLRRPLPWFGWLALAVTQCAWGFVKIHAVTLFAVPTVVAWWTGVRGRRLVGVALASAVAPAVGWAAVFHALDWWPSIERAWNTKETFYGQWTSLRVAWVSAWTALPFALGALARPRWWRGETGALGAVILGYVALLAACSLPPLQRFLYPVVGLAAVVAMSGAVQRWGPRRAVWWGASVVAVGWFVISWVLVGVDLYGRHIGNAKHVMPQVFLQLRN